ncbi:MAG TPA: cupin domain-containing protein [Thalassobaculum sp.]
MADQYLPATPTVQVDDERVRVTEWRIPKGGATSWHRHEMPYVVIPIEGGRLRVATADGDVQAEMVAGKAYSRPLGVEHDVINDDDHDIVFIEVELKE